jgi:hypothetical protein
MNKQKKQLILEIICALLIVLFLYTGVEKLINLRGFKESLMYQPFPHWLSSLLVYLLPTVELSIVLLLIFERTRLVGLISSFVVMVIFTAYASLVLVKVFGFTPCACGGIIKNLSWPQHLLFNTFYAILTIIGIILRNENNNKSISFRSHLENA